MARFVCEECYETNGSREYPLAPKVVELNKNAIEQIVPDGKKPGFHAGYLMGKKEVTDAGYKIVVEKMIDSVQAGKGTANFFIKDDVMNLRKIFRAEGIAIVGLYRTSPSGSPDFNLLDNKTLDDMLMDIIYMIIGGNSEIQIAVKDKHSQIDEIGVILT
jgi:proteasome lid subunit RPN8/RPN11